IKGAGKQVHAKILGYFLQFGLPVPRCVGLLIEAVEGLAIPQRATLDSETLLVAVNGNCVCGISLQFDSIGTGALGSFDDANRLIEVLVVIRGQLCDEIGWLTWPHATPVDRDVTHGNGARSST